MEIVVCLVFFALLCFQMQYDVAHKQDTIKKKKNIMMIYDLEHAKHKK